MNDCTAMNDTPLSYTYPRTLEGLRVALAGLPASTPVRIDAGVELEAQLVGELRALGRVPHRLEVVIPYQLRQDRVVEINRPSDEWSEHD